MEAIVEGLQHGCPGVRTAALSAFGSLSAAAKDKCAEHILPLLADDDEALHRSARDALLEVSGDALLATLEDVLAHFVDPRPHVRNATYGVLRQVDGVDLARRTEEIARALTPLWRDAKDAEVRDDAMSFLISLNAERKASEYQTSMWLKKIEAYPLERAVKAVADRAWDVQIVTTSLQDPRADVRKTAARILGHYCESAPKLFERFGKTVVSMVCGDGSISVRQEAAAVLLRVDPELLRPHAKALAAMLETRYRNLRLAILKALTRLDAQTIALNALEIARLADDKDYEIQKQAVEALNHADETELSIVLDCVLDVKKAPEAFARRARDIWQRRHFAEAGV
eukprot:TRINITY_DN10614_c0_g1_i1.p1 TRINITY_DN10614_c0_g1~~TRINITY_DN10614_c0_g1_i1.p1  ORF type:complete len:373 (+),score=110.33 TRINITY_DN10614_c0_g1_i1:96-1121(+)